LVRASACAHQANANAPKTSKNRIESSISSFAALRHEGHPTEGLSTIVTLLGLRFPPGKDERMFLYPDFFTLS
jgi:hypothetical protein